MSNHYRLEVRPLPNGWTETRFTTPPGDKPVQMCRVTGDEARVAIIQLFIASTAAFAHALNATELAIQLSHAWALLQNPRDFYAQIARVARLREMQAAQKDQANGR